MKASEVTCPKCGGSLVDIDPNWEFDFQLPTKETWTMAACCNGHKVRIHSRPTKDGPIQHSVEAT